MFHRNGSLDLYGQKGQPVDYKLLETIGRGTYGIVWKALHSKSGQIIAIKVVTLEKEDLDSFRSEVDILRKFSRHKNIACYYNSFINKQFPGKTEELWIVMEYCSVGTLETLIRACKGNSLPETWIQFTTREVLAGLAYLHSNKIIHRDIKGQNVLITHRVEIKLVDFGVSALVDKAVGGRNTFIGTPYWMPPEVINCENSKSALYDDRCDIWSLGITVIQMAEGKPPLSDYHPMKALLLIPTVPPPRLKRGPSWSAKMHEFLKLSLQRNYLDRPDSTELAKHPFLQLDEAAVLQTIKRIQDLFGREKRVEVAKELNVKLPSPPKQSVGSTDETIKNDATLRPALVNRDSFRKTKRFTLTEAKESPPSEVIRREPRQNVVPEIRKYKIKFQSDVFCASPLRKNLLVGTSQGLFLLDQSSRGDLYQMTKESVFQVQVLEELDCVVMITRQIYCLNCTSLTYLLGSMSSRKRSTQMNRQLIYRTFMGCTCFRTVAINDVSYLLIAVGFSIEIYTWNREKHTMFVPFKAVKSLPDRPLVVNLIADKQNTLKVLYGSSCGFHMFNLSTNSVSQIYTSDDAMTNSIIPHDLSLYRDCLFLLYNNRGVFVDMEGRLIPEMPPVKFSDEVCNVTFLPPDLLLVWNAESITMMSASSGVVMGYFVHKKLESLHFLCSSQRNVFFSNGRTANSLPQLYILNLADTISDTKN